MSSTAEHIDQMATEDDSLSSLSLKSHGGFMIPSCAPPPPLIVNSSINISLVDIINAFNTDTLGDPLEMYKNIISLHLSKSSETNAKLFLNELVVTQSNLNTSSESNFKWLADLYNMVIAISLLKILPDEAKQSLISQSSTFWNDCIAHLPHNPLETASD